MNKCIKNYYDNGSFMTIAQTKKHVDGLTNFIRSKRSYYRRHVLTREEREEVLLEMEIQLEIDYYECCLSQIKKEEIQE